MAFYDADASFARLTRIGEAMAAQVAHVASLPEPSREKAQQNLSLLKNMYLIAEKTHRLVLAAVAISTDDPYLIGAKFWPTEPTQSGSELPPP